jgi:hypothetical protein
LPLALLLLLLLLLLLHEPADFRQRTLHRLRPLAVQLHLGDVSPHLFRLLLPAAQPASGGRSSHQIISAVQQH